jgi:hypothetical protein
MWSQVQNHTPGQSQGVHHDQASLMAHAAARKAAVMKVLSGGGGASPTGNLGAAPPASPMPGAGPMQPPAPHHNFKAHVAAAGAAHGVPLGMGDIHGAIDSLTQSGHFTPGQGAALKAHNGPLQGPAGVQTMHAITQRALAQTPMPGQ